MKGLLFLLSVGVAIYTLLVASHNALTDGEPRDVVAAHTRPDDRVWQRLGSSWGSHLARRSPNSQQSASPPSQHDLTEPGENSARKPDAFYRLSSPEVSRRASGGTDAALVEDGHNDTQAAVDPKPLTDKVASSKSKKSSRSAKRSKNVSLSKPRRGAHKVAKWDPRKIRWARRASRRDDFRVMMVSPRFGERRY
jgi:hypothetical protein